MGKISYGLMVMGLLSTVGALTIKSSDLPVEARDVYDSQEEDLFSSSYILPNQIFNDGKPFYVGKDPVSGQLDFSAKKPAGIEPAANEVFDPKEKIVFSSSSPNIHDFLNLPVKYSSSKFVYPLVSSSYANLKYQGNNKNFITNKKPQSLSVPVAPGIQHPTQSPSSNDFFKEKSNSTKLHSVLSTTPKIQTTTPTSTTIKTTYPPRYTTTSRPVSSTSTHTPHTSTTRKKFIPTKKLSSTSTQLIPITTESFKENLATSSQTTILINTKPEISQKPSTPSEAGMDWSAVTTASSKVVTDSPLAHNPVSSSTYLPNLEPGDIYQAVENKKGEKEHSKNTMSLADIFNTLAEVEPEFSYNNQENKPTDAKNHLMQPFTAVKPSPFVKPSASPSTVSYTSVAITKSPPAQDQKANVKPTYENFSSEYVQYQVQQPNMMQYRPIPGSINNVVISPGQNSATFVLGSQQTVGSNSFGGTVEKEPLFAKSPSVQYGTVINEEINGMARPNPIAQNTNLQVQTSNAQFQFQQLPSQETSNFHQNGNAQPASAPGNAYLYQGSNGPNNPSDSSSLQQHPTAPSLFQQLPLQNNKPQTSNHPNFSQGGTSEIRLQESFGSVSGPQAAYQKRPQQPAVQEEKKPHSQTNFHQTIPMSGEQETQELLVSSNFRFPPNEEHSEENLSSNQPPQTGHSSVNGHANPLSLQQIKTNSNQVIFPKNEENKSGTVPAGAINPELNEVPYNNNNDIQIQKHEVLTLNQHQQQLKQKFNFSQQPHAVPPVQHMEPPRFFPRPPEHHVSNKAPVPQEYVPSVPHISSYPYNEFTRKPIPGMNRPIPDRPLPNILPQFRPNAKLSSGHGPNLNGEPGNLRIPPHFYGKRPSSPQFAHRRQPVVAHRYPMNRILEYPAGPNSPQLDVNRRIYRLPPYGGQTQFTDRMNSKRPNFGPQIIRQADGYIIERRSPHERQDVYQTIPHHQVLPQPQQQQQKQHLHSLDSEILAPFEENDFAINEPPQPVTPVKDGEKNQEAAKLEPVITLQMLQSQKKVGTDEIYNSKVDETLASNKDALTSFEKISPSQGLYVVYPLKPNNDLEEPDTNDAIESKDPSPSIVPYDLGTNNDYQNTPFSVVRDQPQEPILMVKNKKPQSLQQHQQQKHQPSKDKFPYRIEKPDPSYTHLTYFKDKNSGTMIAPRIMNGGQSSFTGTEAPIAIAYTPTEKHVHYPANHKADINKFSSVNLASSVIHEIRDTQTEDGLTEIFDTRGQNFERDFMAPFYPSVSLNSATNSPSNGWSVYHRDSSTVRSLLYEKNNIDRADVGVEIPDSKSFSSLETTTKSFELDSFQPELQGGFRPIYPTGFKIEENGERKVNRPIALPSRMEKESTTSTTTTKSSIPESFGSYNSTVQPSAAAFTATTNDPILEAVKPIQHKKSVFETSLEALLFGDDEDSEANANQTSAVNSADESS